MDGFGSGGRAEGDVHGRSARNSVADLDVAAVIHDGPAGDRQAETAAARVGGLSAIELLEDLFTLRDRDADALVADRDVHEAIVLARANRERLPLRGVLDRVV